MLTELLHRKDDEIKSACDQKNELFIKLLEIYNMRDLSRVGNSCLPSASHTTNIKLIENSNKICPALYQVLFFLHKFSHRKFIGRKVLLNFSTSQYKIILLALLAIVFYFVKKINFKIDSYSLIFV